MSEFSEKGGDQRLRVLISAYACEPGRGSEPGVGWKWANGMAGRVDLTVLTRSSNRREIEAALESMAEDEPLRNVRFVYADLPSWVLWLKRRRFLPVMLYYLMWQVAVSHRFKHLVESCDVVHHLTFCTLFCPGLWKPRRASFVIGPVGAPMASPPYLQLFGWGQLVQRIRNWALSHFHWLPWLRRALRVADVVVPANSDTKRLLEERGFATADVMLDTGAPEVGLERVETPEETVRFVFAGRLERRKGLELSLRALARADRDAANWKFAIVGDGPDADRLKELASRLGILGKVEFCGLRTQKETFKDLAESDVFMFSSIRDTSAGVNLEAMALGLPIVCIAHQGVKDITDDSCALRVPPGSIERTIEDLATAAVELIRDPERRVRLGSAGRERAKRRFSWDAKFEAMQNYYELAYESKLGANSTEKGDRH